MKSPFKCFCTHDRCWNLSISSCFLYKAEKLPHEFVFKERSRQTRWPYHFVNVQMLVVLPGRCGCFASWQRCIVAELQQVMVCLAAAPQIGSLDWLQASFSLLLFVLLGLHLILGFYDPLSLQSWALRRLCCTSQHVAASLGLHAFCCGNLEPGRSLSWSTKKATPHLLLRHHEDTNTSKSFSQSKCSDRKSCWRKTKDSGWMLCTEQHLL